MNKKKIASVVMGGLRYWQKIKNLGPIAYWPLWDAVGASSAIDLMGLGNGTPANVTFGAAGIGDGRTSGSFNGSSSVVDVYSAALNTAFSGAAGSITFFLKVSSSAIWSDTVVRYPFLIGADNNNRIFFRRNAANNRIDAFYIAGSTTKSQALTSLTSTGFIPFAVTWNKTADEVKFFVNGAQVGSTGTGLGTWAGALNSSACVIGSVDTTPTAADTWSGLIAHFVVYAKTLTPAEVLQVANPT